MSKAQQHERGGGGHLFASQPRVDTDTKWRPASLPELGGVGWVGFDTEGTGKNKHKDRPVGLSYHAEDGRRGYLPWGHKGGGNLDESVIKRWAQKELVNKDLVGLNIGHDAEQMLKWGVDLEKQGCRLHDVGFAAALINEHRYDGFNLDSLGREFVGRGKRELNIDPDKIWQAPASDVGPYATDDATLAWDVHVAQQPMIHKDNLTRVLNLENSLMWCVNHMERNGSRLDLEKLARWRREAKEKLANLQIEIYNDVGFRVNPNSHPDMDKLWHRMRFAPVDSYDAKTLKSIDHHIVKKCLRARQTASILSKYLDKYWRVRDNDILRYSLHQLRGDEYGTISGRFSSANVNIQQVMKVANQIEEFGDEYIIRELFIPDDGYLDFAADGNQVEFRIFAHYANAPKLIKRYNEDPDVDFHELVAIIMYGNAYLNADKAHKKFMRQQAKHNNFGVVYGMGLQKLARRLGLACTCGLDDAYDENRPFYKHSSHDTGCPAHQAIDISEKYHSEFPEARMLLNKASDVARRRGFVKSLLGRMFRFTGARATGFHAALNRVIQGGAADVNKMKLLQVYNNMSTLGIHKLRRTVHDEMGGDVDRDPMYHKRITECLDELPFECRVPLPWDLEVGANWRVTTQ